MPLEPVATPSPSDGRKKGPRRGPSSACRTERSGGGRQRLDLGGEAALVARGLVLVEEVLVGDRVDDRLGGLEELGGLGLVAGGERLLHVFDDGAELRAHGRV